MQIKFIFNHRQCDIIIFDESFSELLSKYILRGLPFYIFKQRPEVFELDYWLKIEIKIVKRIKLKCLLSNFPVRKRKRFIEPMNNPIKNDGGIGITEKIRPISTNRSWFLTQNRNFFFKSRTKSSRALDGIFKTRKEKKLKIIYQLVNLFPSISLKVPQRIKMKSMKDQINKPPKVKNCKTPVPTFPT